MAYLYHSTKQSNRKVQEAPPSQAAAHPKHEEEDELDKTKQAQVGNWNEKHVRNTVR